MDYIANFLSLFGGIGLFLFGMKYLSDGLQQTAGAKLTALMEKLTRTVWRGFLLGTLVTAVIQSSSATTVMAMGFINAGIINLTQATGVIIGSNIGTTITSILIALDISFIAPVCIFVGAATLLFAQKSLYKNIGQIVLGFGILFLGLETMSSSMSIFKTDPTFREIIASVNNPIVGFLVGIFMCALMQSSSASVGILQALALQGLMPLSTSAFIICGINISASLPPLISSIGAKHSAKRAALIYLICNVAGAVIFVPLTLLVPAFITLIENIFAEQVAQIAAYHILFNTVTAFVLLPFSSKIVMLAEKIIPKSPHEQFELRLMYIDPKIESVSGITAHQIRNEVNRMGGLALENISLACSAIKTGDTSKAEEIREREKLLDYMNHAITDYLVEINRNAISEELSEYIGRVFHVINDIERIGDHAYNILQRAEDFKEKGFTLTEPAAKDFTEVEDRCTGMFKEVLASFYKESETEEQKNKLHSWEDSIDMLTKKAQSNHFERLKEGVSQTEPGIMYIKMLHDMERIGDHCDNIVWATK